MPRTKKVIPSPLKVAGKEAVDACFSVATLNEARENAYPGYYCFVESENKHYKFKFNEQKNLIPYPDETVNTDFFAAKGEVDKKAEKEYVDTELAKKSNTGHAHSAYSDANHLHDTRYAQKSEITEFATRAEVGAKADNSHRHDADYASKTHGHSGYATADHLHDERYPTRAELLNGAGIQQYVHPQTHPASMIATDVLRRFTSDVEMATKIDKVSGKSLVLDTELIRLGKLKEVAASAQNGNIKLDGVEMFVYQHPEGTNPHGLTAADIALEKVTNESKATMFNNPVFTGEVAIPEPVNGNNPVTKNNQELELFKKVDKVPGKSLVLDSEIERLAVLKKVSASAQNGKLKLDENEIVVYSHPEGTNPHGLTAADIALEKVTNESKATMFNNPVFTGDVTVPEPTTDKNPTTKSFVENYVDNRITGLDQKPACRVATVSSILLSGLQTVDGVNVGIGDRILVKNQTDATKNGIYTITAGAWIRALDFDNAPKEEIRTGTYVFINEGTKNNNSGWRLTTYGTIVIGTSELLFAQFNGLAQTSAGDGLLKNGNEYSLDLTRIATQSANGLMSSADKTKLDGIAIGANNYVHPATHPASVINQDASNRFVSDTEKAAWNGKASTAVATQAASGLMSLADKIKLDNVAAGATNYVHPATHPASVISQDASNRFVSDIEKAAWNGKASTTVATQAANGLMSLADKTKLDNVAVGAEVNVQADWNETDTSSDSYFKNRPDFSKKTRDNCRVATTVNVSLAAAPNLADGVSLAVGDRVFVSRQTNKTQNGIYRVSTVGTGASGVWVRVSDADSWSKLFGCLVAVEEGVTLADTGWFCKADTAGALGTTDIIFQQIFGTGTYNGGVGIAFNNGSFSFSSADANMLPGYTKAAASAAIVPADSVNAALGKLEKSLDERQRAGSIKSIGSGYGDFIEAVILLHEVYNGVSIDRNYCIADITLIRGDVLALKRFSAIKINTISVNTATDGNIQSIGLNATLVTCLYKNKKYIAIRLPYAAPLFQSFIYSGVIVSTAESLMLIGYKNNSTSEVINAEVNNSILPFNSTLTSFFDNDLKCRGLVFKVQAVDYNSVVNFDYTQGLATSITLTGNTTLSMSNIPDGGRGVITLIQDATGSRLLTAITHAGLTVKYKNGDNVLTTTANKTDLIRYERVGTVLFVTLDKNY